jgi:protein phosphatase
VLRAYGVTDKGRVRPTNEDCFAVDEGLRLCVVADGMGGHNAGEVAARIAVDAAVDFIARLHVGQPEHAATWPLGFDPLLSRSGNLLRTAILLANMEILETASSSDEYAGMGTTIVAAMIDAQKLSVAHVGDSRLYLVAKNRIRQITRDDSWMASVLADDPRADLGTLLQHPMCNALTNVVGAGPRTEVHVVEETLGGGELLVLSTDGVHGVLDDDRLERLVLEGGNPRQIATSLVGAALARGSRDNCTAVVARYLPD